MLLRPYREASFGSPPARTGGRLPRLLLLSLLGLAIAAAGYSAWWWMAAGTLRDRTLNWIEQRRAEGWQLDHAGLERAGFPLQVAVRVGAPRVTLAAGTLAWSAGHLRVAVPVGVGRDTVVETRGAQSLEVLADGARRRFDGTVERAAFAPARGGWLPTGRLAIDRLALAEAGRDGVSIERLDLVTEGDPAMTAAAGVRTYTLRLNGSGVRAGAPEATPGTEAGEVALEAHLQGTLAAQPWPAALARWRDDGGTVEVTTLALKLGERIAVDGDGTLALDRDGQPQAALSLRIRGHGAALDRLAAAGVLSAHTVAAAKILLRAKARSGSDGPETLTTPLTLQDRTLSVGPVPLLAVPEADWLPPRSPTR